MDRKMVTDIHLDDDDQFMYNDCVVRSIRVHHDTPGHFKFSLKVTRPNGRGARMFGVQFRKIPDSLLRKAKGIHANWDNPQ